MLWIRSAKQKTPQCCVWLLHDLVDGERQKFSSPALPKSEQMSAIKRNLGARVHHVPKSWFKIFRKASSLRERMGHVHDPTNCLPRFRFNIQQRLQSPTFELVAGRESSAGRGGLPMNFPRSCRKRLPLAIVGRNCQGKRRSQMSKWVDKKLRDLHRKCRAQTPWID